MEQGRLFKIVYHLLDKGRATAPELAEKFEVSVRTMAYAVKMAYKKTAKEDWKKLSEKYKKENEPIVEEIKKKSEKEKRDKEIEDLIAKAIKKALAETGKKENKSVEE